jgi:hypothetical protein
LEEEKKIERKKTVIKVKGQPDIDDEDEEDNKKTGVSGATLAAAGTSPEIEEDPEYDYLEDSINIKSPKLTLIEHLRLLADIFNSSLDEANEYYD